MSLTLIDISKQIGVSTATISRVLHDEGNVTPETKKLVLDALQCNDYHYRPRRKSAMSKNTDTMLIIAGQLSNPITVAYIDSIREALEAHGKQSLVALSSYSSASEVSFLRYAKESGFAGIFLLNAIENDELVGLLKKITAPVIFVNRYLRCMDGNVVTSDNYRCGYLATQYLAERGHVRIGHFAGPEDSITCQDRTEGFLDAMRARGLEIFPQSVFYGSLNYQSGYEFGEMICAMPPEQRFTGVFCTAGLMAPGMVDALVTGGLTIPEDVSVVISDDANTHTQAAELTAVDQNPHAMGAAAVELLLERLKNPSQPPRRIIYPPILTERGSVRVLTQP